ncbi:hypothetical protein WK47_25085 [Burkholderia ubonensis]|nr:hypothetical protein WJ74_10745 [Burkholderia ubonensis]KVT01151.1 hypothetical protein WK47_25085 [Burkholderia ubonensis]KVT07416.1 hypothetical protein WK46_10820 [Burkholderia ubonensis]KVT33807.1 hypothetical protein WK50_02465 [Burkholderia ubonensis]
MDRAFAELKGADQQISIGSDAIASRRAPAEHEQAIARVGDDAAAMHAPMSVHGSDVEPIDGVPSGDVA